MKAPPKRLSQTPRGIFCRLEGEAEAFGDAQTLYWNGVVAGLQAGIPLPASETAELLRLIDECRK